MGQSTYETAARLETIRRHLESGGSLNTTDIAAQHNVSRRTGLRDIKFLRAGFGLPIAYDASYKVFYLAPKGAPLMAIRKTVYLSDQSEAILGQVDSRSGRLNNIIIRYGAIIAAECPALTEAEWLLICDMLNATVLDTDHRDTDPARFLWADIAESGKLDGLAEKWEVDTEALSQRVRAMSYAQQVAIVEAVAKFWRSPNLNQIPTADLLKESGAKIS